jgi:diguanylate cyclase (GGDEF)-like protein
MNRPTPPALRPVNVLVVDDVEDTLVTMRMLLEQPGLTVLTAPSAAEALKLLHEHEVALALLDVEMPQVNGFALAEQMRRGERTRGVPIIFISGHRFDASRVFSGYEAGAVDVLYKPVEPVVLLSKVGVFVELHRQRQELLERNEELHRLLRRNEAMANELRAEHRKAVQEALTDPLTGVPNRRQILRLADQALSDPQTDDRPVSLTMIDLDHFKAINDEHGHACGDAVLRDFCRHCREHLPKHDALGRLGGEEFLIVMPATTVDEARDATETLRSSLRPYRGIEYTFSAGLTPVDAEEPLARALKRADDALYRAKRLGRNRTELSMG